MKKGPIYHGSRSTMHSVPGEGTQKQQEQKTQPQNNTTTKTHTQKTSWGFWFEAISPSPDFLRSQEKSYRQKQLCVRLTRCGKWTLLWIYFILTPNTALQLFYDTAKVKLLQNKYSCMWLLQKCHWIISNFSARCSKNCFLMQSRKQEKRWFT